MIFSDFDKLDETDLVCLGDRLVKEDQYVGLNDRIDYIIHKAGNRPEVNKKNITKESRNPEVYEVHRRIDRTNY